MSGIYVSSKVRHAGMWQDWRDQGYPICSTWIDTPIPIPNDVIGRVYWPIWLKEAHAANALVVYSEPGDENHTGCLLEVGAALAGGALIFQVGESNTFKTTMGRRCDFMAAWRSMPDLKSAMDEAMRFVPSK